MTITTPVILAAPYQAGTVVCDAADPGVHGQIIQVGPEVSEVRFDDGVQRYVGNDHLRAVEVPPAAADQLTGSTHPDPENTAIQRGQEAWRRLRNHSTLEDWKAVGKACVIGQSTAMRDAHVNVPKGRGYNAAIFAWDKKHGFQDLDKGVRSRLLDVMRHLAEIEVELAKLPLTKRLRFNHPNAVWRFWKKVTKPKDPEGSEEKPRHVRIPQADYVKLLEEHDRMRREIAHGGGDLWTPTDTAKEIAKIMVGKLTPDKAGSVAREILAALKKTRVARGVKKVRGAK
jgi:hypothetical protein